ncbi:MAG: histone deacetylase [Candidatus Bathyarchaeota archaeon]|nr:histone deacetylase [Candidatus Bathyarchaeota archaeon]
MRIVFSERCLEYFEPGHPESPERILNIYVLLKKEGFKFIEAEPCCEEDLLMVHSEEHVKRIKSGEFYDPDTPSIPGIYDYARLAVGAAIKSMEISLEGEKAFSLMRPPGHHAGVNGRALGAPTLGFCYFNNIAVACRKALRNGEINKIAILDIDCHHGNGTQEIFFRDPQVLFISLHRYGGIYPGTGERSLENCLNYPFLHPVSDEEYIRVLGFALGEIEKFNPELIAISAGFDAHKCDPVCGLGLSAKSYAVIGRMISKLNRKVFIVLEGGYGGEVPQCVLNFLKGLEEG